MDVQYTPYVCSNYSLFGAGQGSIPEQNCFSALCTPRKIQLDVGGIGVGQPCDNQSLA